MALVILLTAEQHVVVSAAAGAAAYGAAVIGLALLRAPGERHRRPARALAALVSPTR